jgi:hypothetical protein
MLRGASFSARRPDLSLSVRLLASDHRARGVGGRAVSIGHRSPDPQAVGRVMRV